MANYSDKPEGVITSPPATGSADGSKRAGHKAAYHMMHGIMLLMAIFGVVCGSHEEDKGNTGRSIFFYAMVFGAVIMLEFFTWLEAECDRLDI